MIRIFCDCCGKEISPVNVKSHSIHFPAKRVHIERYSSSIKCGFYENFLVELVVTANIYKPENLLNEVKAKNFVGNNLCGDCIIETLVQKGD